MKYLVDANVLSEPAKPEHHVRVVRWLTENERHLAVDPVILGEIRFGILLLPRGKRRARLERWFEEIVRRVLCFPWEAETGLRWAELLAALRAAGRAMPIKDSFIAGDGARARSCSGHTQQGLFREGGRGDPRSI